VSTTIQPSMEDAPSAVAAPGGQGKAASTTIDIFLRVRPVAQPSAKVQLDLTDSKVEFNLPRDTASG